MRKKLTGGKLRIATLLALLALGFWAISGYFSAPSTANDDKVTPSQDHTSAVRRAKTVTKISSRTSCRPRTPSWESEELERQSDRL
jgi:hypothetical protein